MVGTAAIDQMYLLMLYLFKLHPNDIPTIIVIISHMLPLDTVRSIDLGISINTETLPPEAKVRLLTFRRLHKDPVKSYCFTANIVRWNSQ